jgi:hypothetical protein
MVDAAIQNQTSEPLGEFRSALAKVPVDFLEDLACGVATNIQMGYSRSYRYQHNCQCNAAWGTPPDPCTCDLVTVLERKHHGLDYYLNWVDPEKPKVDVAAPDGDDSTPGDDAWAEGFGDRSESGPTVGDFLDYMFDETEE